MAYGDFSLAKVKKEFGLTEEKIKLFPNANLIEPSEWLKTTLAISLRLALASSSEKARSEFIVALLLLELEIINNQSFSIFSGERLDVLPEDRHIAVGKETGKKNHIERFNNTLRQRVSRLVRKTLSFSKKLENHIGAIWYFIHYYNASLQI